MQLSQFITTAESAYAKKCKHFLMLINYIREQVDLGIIKILKIPGQNNMSDVVIKSNFNEKDFEKRRMASLESVFWIINSTLINIFYKICSTLIYTTCPSEFGHFWMFRLLSRTLHICSNNIMYSWEYVFLNIYTFSHNSFHTWRGMASYQSIASSWVRYLVCLTV